MSKQSWSLSDNLELFELSNAHAHSAVWKDEQALYIDSETGIGTSVLLRDEVSFESFRLEVEIATPHSFAFIGIVFGATDINNYELVYVSPGSDSTAGEIQYDPIMNGSSTWQIYHGPKYQAPAPFFPGEWTKLALVVHSNSVAIYVGDTDVPQLIIPNLQSGSLGKIGVWGYLPSYLRNFSVEQIQPSIFSSSPTDLKQLAEEGFITEWEISQPYLKNGQSVPKDNWSYAAVEENGTLNLNRPFTSTKDSAVQVQCKFTLAEEKETWLTWGFSDRLKLWVNDIEIYQGEWKWDPPHSDGRIRFDFASTAVCWNAGLNTIQAEVARDEVAFGWGLSVKTGLSADERS
ncbi:hypothetical protein EHS13_26730 [Paenibacillus psychroresistens]|uniref:Uncharacterized protein n=1 Tax=Paenibacillus psychroresistens TaxID=1778678 RepID=A0A6B8RRQ5_9BACL|nr:hypothetical protein [Paenibacillus psychroresistens]QGQ98225.1 hypothetical protein EHS13_26730 [Paenibacillus psychroresistens]